MRPLLVGESNPYGSNPKYALYPNPEHSAGGRLCFKVMGLTQREYLERFDRVNLCAVGKWSMKAAKERAALLVAFGEPSPVVLLGAKVCGAFFLKFEPFKSFQVVCHAKSRLCVILPHPSGLSRAWNEPGAFERARAVLREAGVL